MRITIVVAGTRSIYKKQDEYKKAVWEKVENKKLFQRRTFFGEGEQVGRILALISKANSPSNIISAIQEKEGDIRRTTSEIAYEFKEYYKNLYSTSQRNVEREMGGFFQKLRIPQLSEDRDGLDAPLTLEELRKATADMAGQKAPGPDGLTIEIYKKYGDILLPKLLQVFNGAMEEEKLPTSM